MTLDTMSRDALLEMIDDLENQVTGLSAGTRTGKVSQAMGGREWSIAMTKMEECAMWMRRAIEGIRE